MSDHFADTPIIHTLRSVYFGSDDAPSEQVWGEYKTIFTAMRPEYRRHELHAIDNHLAGELSPTRETASTISAQRQLRDIDALLRKAGR
jgi:hypothetical protein